MIRVLKIASGLMGVLLLVMVGVMSLIRTSDPLPIMLISRRVAFQEDWYLLVARHIESKHQWRIGNNQVRQVIGVAADNSLIYWDTWKLYRLTQPYETPQLLADDVKEYSVTLSPDRRWIFYRKFGLMGDGYHTRDAVISLRYDGRKRHDVSQNLPTGVEIQSNAGYLLLNDDWLRLETYAILSDGQYQFDTYVVKRDGSELTLVTSPVGQKVYNDYWAKRGSLQLERGSVYRLDEETGQYTPIIAQDTAPRMQEFAYWLPIHHQWVVINDARDWIWGVAEDGNILWERELPPYYAINPQIERLIMLTDNRTPATLNLVMGEQQSYLPVSISTISPNVWSPDDKWVVCYGHNNQTGLEELWRLDSDGTAAKIWSEAGADIFWLWPSPDSGEILIHAATPKWSGLLMLRPDGSDARQITDVREIELGNHSFAGWWSMKVSDWQPVLLAAIALTLITMPILLSRLHRRPHPANI